MHVTDPIFVWRLKINYKTLGAHVFILENRPIANSTPIDNSQGAFLYWTKNAYVQQTMVMIIFCLIILCRVSLCSMQNKINCLLRHLKNK